MNLKIAILTLIAVLVICLAPLSQSMPALAADNVTVDSTNNVDVDVDVVVQVSPPPPSLPDPPALPDPPDPSDPPDPPAPLSPNPPTPNPPPPAPPAAKPVPPKPVIQLKLPPPLPKFNQCCNSCCDPCCQCVSTCVTVCPPCPPSWDCYGCRDYDNCYDCYDDCDCQNCSSCCDYKHCCDCWGDCQTTVVVKTKQQTVCPPVISSFTANPSCVEPCQDVVLTWTAINTEKVTLSPGIGAVPNTGSYKVSICSTTTYTLTASNSDGTVSASTTVTVVPSVSNYDIGGHISGTAGIATADTGSVLTSWLKNISGQNNSNLLFILLIALLAAAAAGIVILVRKPALARAGSHSATMVRYLPWSTSTMEQTETPKTTTATAVGMAKFTIVDGGQIPIRGNGGVMGRDDFRQLVSSDKANLISREHIWVSYENGKYYIEDLKSTNGTKINGSIIDYKSKVQLSDGDVILLADVLTLTFKT